AASVADALPLLESASARREPFNLAVIDANLPGEDGYDAAERIRARLASPKAVILMLRTDRQREDIARCASFGIEHYVVKPIRISQLRNTVMQALGACAPADNDTRPAAPAPAKKAGPLQILLAEDNSVNQLVMTRLLSKRGHEVTVVGNGLEAVNAVRERRFDLVFMDVQMPGLDGS